MRMRFRRRRDEEEVGKGENLVRRRLKGRRD